MNLIKYVPRESLGLIPTLTLAPCAVAQLDRVTDELGVKLPMEDAAKSIAGSAAAFRSSAYFKSNDWFPTLPCHPFHALHINCPDETIVTPTLMYSWKDGVIYGEDSIELADNYPEIRVIEEVKAEYFCLNRPKKEDNK
jgi:hypothetical protein